MLDKGSRFWCRKVSFTGSTEVDKVTINDDALSCQCKNKMWMKEVKVKIYHVKKAGIEVVKEVAYVMVLSAGLIKVEKY